MIQVSDSKELKPKTSKSALAATAEREAFRLDKVQLLYALGIAGIIVLVAFLEKAGWFVLPAVFVLAYLFNKRGNEIKELRGRAVAYKSLKPKV